MKNKTETSTNQTLHSNSGIKILVLVILAVLMAGIALKSSILDSAAAVSPRLKLAASSRAKIEFRDNNGAGEAIDIPHLVLTRNGEPTEAGERTLVVEYGPVAVPTGGAVLMLNVSTMVGGKQVVVLEVSQVLANATENQQTERQIGFQVVVPAEIKMGTGYTTTPSGYYQVEMTVKNGDRVLAQEVYQTAFLLEQQVIVPLPQVNERTSGAAPDELVIYFSDTFEFEGSQGRMPREDIADFVIRELAPAMVQAYKKQSNDWGLVWSREWKAFRKEDGSERISVALTERGEWYHGQAPGTGNANITLATNAETYKSYPDLLSGMVSLFHHELFHNQQRNLNLEMGGAGDVDGKNNAWVFFSEGTAVVASVAAQPEIELAESNNKAIFQTQAATFLAGDAFHGNSLNTSYREMYPYQSAVYFYYLYETCGGMEIIQNVLRSLYDRRIVDITSTTDLVGSLPVVMDAALANTERCAAHTYRQSLEGFGRHIYLMGIDQQAASLPKAAVETARVENNTTEIKGEIGTSYGIDLIEVELSEKLAINDLAINLSETQGAVFEVQVLGEDGKTLHRDMAGEVELSGNKSVTLVVTRMDSGEAQVGGGYKVSFLVR